jgi:hypothetical protein
MLTQSSLAPILSITRDPKSTCRQGFILLPSEQLKDAERSEDEAVEGRSLRPAIHAAAALRADLR